MSCQNCSSERVMVVNAKCSDLCFIDLDEKEHNGYVPDGFGIGGGDYIEFELCMNCGTVQGTWPNNSTLSEK